MVPGMIDVRVRVRVRERARGGGGGRVVETRRAACTVQCIIPTHTNHFHLHVTHSYTHTHTRTRAHNSIALLCYDETHTRFVSDALFFCPFQNRWGGYENTAGLRTFLPLSLRR